MGSDGTVGANKEAVKIIAGQPGMHAQVRVGAGWGVRGGALCGYWCWRTIPHNGSRPTAMSIEQYARPWPSNNNRPPPPRPLPHPPLLTLRTPHPHPAPHPPKAYFAYDAHKSGGVTTSHLRFGKEPIRAPYLVAAADYIGVHQPQYLIK